MKTGSATRSNFVRVHIFQFMSNFRRDRSIVPLRDIVLRKFLLLLVSGRCLNKSAKMLWKKEKVKGHPIYVKIFDTGLAGIYSQCGQFMTDVMFNVNETSTTKNNFISDVVVHNAVLMGAQKANPEKILELINQAAVKVLVGHMVFEQSVSSN